MNDQSVKSENTDGALKDAADVSPSRVWRPPARRRLPRARPRPSSMVVTALDAPRQGVKKRRSKSQMDQGRKGHVVEGEPPEGGGGGGKIEDMVSREALKRELNAGAQKFAKGAPVNPKKIADRKTKAHVRYAETLADQAATDARCTRSGSAVHPRRRGKPGAWSAPTVFSRLSRRRSRRQRRTQSVRPRPDPRPVRRRFHPQWSRPSMGGGRKEAFVPSSIRWADYKLVTRCSSRRPRATSSSFQQASPPRRRSTCTSTIIGASRFTA